MLRFVSAVLTVTLMLAHEAHAFTIPKQFTDAANKHRVPARVFYAMVTHESKRMVEGAEGIPYRPWPWTINYKGRGYYFETKEAALEFARKRIREGSHLFDIGYGQVNWHYHKHRFASIGDAFDPSTNLDVAAEILAEQFYGNPACNSWVKAVGCYHRPAQRPEDKRIARNYAKLIAREWKRIKDAQNETRLKTVYGDDVELPAPPDRPS